MEPFSAVLALCVGNSPVNGEFPHKGQWRWVLMFSLIFAWPNGWVNKRGAGYLRPHSAHYDVTAMKSAIFDHERHACSIAWYWLSLQYKKIKLIISMFIHSHLLPFCENPSAKILSDKIYNTSNLLKRWRPFGNLTSAGTVILVFRSFLICITRLSDFFWCDSFSAGTLVATPI